VGTMDLFRLDGRTALVTGAGQGIGRGYALALAEAGADVAVISINSENAEAISAEVRERGQRSLAIQADVSRYDAVGQAIETIMNEWGRLDIGVNNVGEAWVANAEDRTEEECDKEIAVSLKSAFQCAQAEARVMLPRESGTIINTTSISGLLASHPYIQAGHSACEAAIIQLTRCLAAEWAQRGIRVNAISSGLIRTVYGTLPSFEVVKQRMIAATPMGRDGQVEELQGALVFLASDASSFMTGQNLVIDGGYTL
jgi:NAD(P)-dependent dehydrogenase (short-subunit alcohol dehydrogenase family)